MRTRPLPTVTSDAPGDPPDDAALVEGIVRGTLDTHASVLGTVDPDTAALTDAIRRSATGGKRLRAAFCLWGSRGAGADLAPGTAAAAAAIELFHLAALVHDDIMDDSATRRGLPTVHRDFADRHRRDRLRGNPATHGTSMAILAGDLCLTWSDDLLATALDDAHRDIRRAARAVWSQMRDEAFAGQTLDMLAQTTSGITRARAHTILRFKSAKYTISQPLRLGGTLARADARLLADYDDIGIHAGEAFQLRDDVLGVFGDPAATGKSNVDDIREGKRTLLVAITEERANRVGRQLLSRALGNPAVRERDVAALRELMESTGARRGVERRIDELTDAALRTVDGLDSDDRTRVALTDLIHRCVRRES
ncbi:MULTISPECIES: polyprenyl synthetase family protein [unclassified Gordonia (in: high G+C Gram-positive bacteria)]